MPSASVTVGAGGAWGYAPPPVIPPCWVLQVTAPRVRLTNRGIPMTFYRGERLPTTTNATENAERQVLVDGGLLRRVTAVASTYDLYTAASAAGKAERADWLATDTASGYTQPGTAAPAVTLTAGGIRFLLL